jgi:hypothetical protein
MTAKIGPCCLCGGRYELYGNNPYPLAKKGRCCRDCNQIVVQARIARARAARGSSGGGRLPALSVNGAAHIMRTKPAKDAPKPRVVKTRSIRPARPLAEELTEKYLMLAYCYPGQSELLTQHRLAGHGFDLANPAARVNRNRALAELKLLEQRLAKSFAKSFAKALKGGRSGDF